MAAGGVQPVPSYVQAATDIYTSIASYLVTVDTDFITYPQRFYKDLFRFCDVSQQDAITVCFLALLWTCLRFILSKGVFSPLASYFRLTKQNAQKFPESAWKTLFYGTTWSFSFYLLIYSGKYDYFYRPNHVWEGWTASSEVPFDIKVAYLVQFSFYMHGVYATIFMDHWRKDSLVMIFHHLLTMALIGFSYGVRHHKIGILVLFLHDIADICLEFTKCNVYFKNRNNKYYAIHDHISTVGFLAFATSWFVFRLYWFPLKVLYSAAQGVTIYRPEQRVPFYFFFNVLLWILQALNIYWFMFILNFLYKVATGQMKEVDDLREDEVTENKDHAEGDRMVQNNHTNSKSVSNGTPSSHKSRKQRVKAD